MKLGAGRAGIRRRVSDPEQGIVHVLQGLPRRKSEAQADGRLGPLGTRWASL